MFQGFHLWLLSSVVGPVAGLITLVRGMCSGAKLLYHDRQELKRKEGTEMSVL